jgi:signal transduction histidine kinase
MRLFPRTLAGQTVLVLLLGAVVSHLLSVLTVSSHHSEGAALSTALMTLGILLASFWAVRRLTRPLSLFAEAAERLGKDVYAPPLPLTGPTELRQAAQAFNLMQERLLRLIDARMQMVAAISHDLRTPITLLKLRAEFVDNEDERARMLATLDEMEAMVASTLSFARQDALKEPSRLVDLGALLTSLCDDLVDAGMAVECGPLGKLPYRCRPLALKRAFLNLVQNAVKYGIRARVGLHPAEHAIEVVVDDDGPGLADEEIAKVFTPFYRVEGSRNADTGGVGLGLSVASSIIHAHGGEIVLSNRAEGGLRATVTLPR